MCASRSAARHWGRSARGSPSWSVRARARTRPAAMTRARPSRPASPRSTRDRSGMEKPGLRPARSVKPMDLRLSTCFIAVDDHDKALAFYRDVLGLEVRNDVGFEGMRWVTVGAPSQPEVDIV